MRESTVTHSVSLLVALVALFTGIGIWIFDYARLAGAVWAAGTIPALIALFLEIVLKLKRGDVGLDIVAALSMTAALVFGENLAANVVALMYAGGQYLERYAQRKASFEIRSLLQRVPRTALRYNGGEINEVPLESIAVNDRLLIRRGDIVPVDGIVADGLAIVDQSALTGEPLPQKKTTSQSILSGCTNVGESFDLIASRIALDSTYYGIVRLIEAAEQSKAPLSRIADKFAIGFLALTIFLAGVAWMIAGEPTRAVAVLVVATPCPLILAVPIALLAGVSSAAKRGILIKGGAPLEVLSRTKIAILDKTGTLTTGNAQVVAIHPCENISANEVLRLAASLDQVSSHVIARVVVNEARSQNLKLQYPKNTIESPGEGIEGDLEKSKIVVGGVGYVSERLKKPPPLSSFSPGALSVLVARDGMYLGQIELADVLRPDTEQILNQLKKIGIERVLLATGDRADVAKSVSEHLPFDEIHSDLLPQDKVRLVSREKRQAVVAMVGDGLNDAPALAIADVGIAMSGRGSAASIEAADVVILADALDRVVSAFRIARRSLKIALQSVYIGLGASIVAMLIAAFGWLPPVHGAILQEVIDVAVIVNALRALRGE